MKKISVILSLIPFLGLQAQTIKGYLFTEKEKRPVEFANVVVLQLPDSIFEAGVISYMDGQFTAENIKPGNYFVKASYVGFEPNGKEVKIAEGANEVWIDTIFLKEKSIEIAGVEVTGDYIRGEELVDRTVYKIPPELEKSSANGYDVLRKIPSVQVDFNYNITLNGSSNFIIQVDGKQRDAEFLGRILPSDIEAIEIIHNPSGKYDGTVDGVINMKLKKEARAGVSGNVIAVVKPVKKPTTFFNGGIDYGFKKITFYVSGYSVYQELVNNTKIYNRFSSLDSISDILGNGNFKVSASAVNTGFDYYINDKNTISLNYSYKPVSVKNKLENTGDIFVDDVIANYQNDNNNTQMSSNESNVSVFYKKEFKKPIQELTAESNIYFFNSKDENSFFNNIYEEDRTTEILSLFRTEDITNNRTYTSTKIDYVQPIGISLRFETGFQFYFQQMDYDFISNNDNLSNEYKYSELRNAAYAGLVWNIKKFAVNATLRAENSNISINKRYDSDYWTFLPSANIQYKFNPFQNIKFTYNRRINRPDLYNLNPFIRLNSDYSISSGNPNLKPEYRDRLQLTYSLNFKKNFIAPYLYHEILTNRIGIKNIIDESSLAEINTKRTIPDNILSGYEQGLGLNARLFVFNLYSRVCKGHFNSFSDSLINIKSQDYFSYSITGNVYKQLMKNTLNVFIFLMYNGVNINAQSKSYSTPIYGFGAQKIIKNHTFGFQYILPFAKEIIINKTITETPYLYSKVANGFDVSYYVQIMYIYKFNKGHAVKKINRQVDVESDSKKEGFNR
jgi:hypothetical protein